MIVATAGHVDHGKTLLVKALTGIDTDRLEEEKRRGLTIDIGFAYLPLEGAESIGFIDVPGHERFIKNALCGLAATDFVLLVVAADDGPMPQTLEHLSIVDLLGFECGAIVITKTDRVTEDRLSDVETRIKTLIRSTVLDSARLFRVSSTTGSGICDLKDFLTRFAKSGPSQATPDGSREKFRLAVDRSFEARGAGFIVTGTIAAGQLRAGEYVSVAGTDLRLRVRELRVHDTPVSRGRRGQRCALNLSGPGLRKQQIRRGTWITAQSPPAPIHRFDARVRTLAQNQRPLRHWAPIHLHLAASEVTARVAVLEAGAIEAGAEALVQIVTDKPIGAVFGDRFVMRDQSARTTLGGGRVIDIFPPRRGRAKLQRIEWLNHLDYDDPAESLQGLLQHYPAGVNLDRFVSNRNLSDQGTAALLDSVAMKTVACGHERYGFSAEAWQSQGQRVLDILKAAQGRASALTVPRLRELAGITMSEALFEQLIDDLHRKSSIERTGTAVRLDNRQNRFDGDDLILWELVDTHLSRAKLKPLSVSELARLTDVDSTRLNAILGQASRLKIIIRISRTLLIKRDVLLEIKNIISEIAGPQSNSGFSVAAFRDATGIGRNRSIDLLEWLDARKITVRDGDMRRLLPSAEQAFRKLLAATE